MPEVHAVSNNETVVYLRTTEWRGALLCSHGLNVLMETINAGAEVLLH